MTKETPPLTLAAIRAAYPEPRQVNVLPSPGHTGYYCVGGAFCLMVSNELICEAFPWASDLASTFRHAIPRLTTEQSNEYADAIIAANDAGRFEEAWELLGEVLEWQDNNDP